jgi:hypothetical protein
MTVKTASANLTSRFTFTPTVGFQPYSQGYLDQTTGSIKAIGNSRWGSLSGTKWSSFSSYITKYLPIKWTSGRVDTGSVDYFTIAITSIFEGSLKYRIYVSATGAFLGEETEYYFDSDNDNIAAFYGRYVYVTVECTGREFTSMKITTSKEVIQYVYRDLDTTTLAGTSSSRLLALDNPISRITEMTVTPKATSYAVDLYVSNTATSSLLIPVIISKTSGGSYITTGYIANDYFQQSTGASFALYGIDNQARDGIVDISLKGLPRQVLQNGNMVVVTA